MTHVLMGIARPFNWRVRRITSWAEQARKMARVRVFQGRAATHTPIAGPGGGPCRPTGEMMRDETEIESSYLGQFLSDVEIVKQDVEVEGEKLRQWRINLRLIRLKPTSDS